MNIRLSLLASPWLLIVGVVAVMLTGCVGVTPLPVTSHVEYGQQVQPAQTAGIRPGRTTRAELVAALGTNYASFRASHSIAYTWEMRGGGGVWWAAVVLGEAAIVKGGNWIGGWRGFLVAFDERDVVRAVEFRKLPGRRSLDETVARWVAKLPPASPPLPATNPTVVSLAAPAR
jgi:hypothetical protein